MFLLGTIIRISLGQLYLVPNKILALMANFQFGLVTPHRYILALMAHLPFGLITLSQFILALMTNQQFGVNALPTPKKMPKMFLALMTDLIVTPLQQHFSIFHSPPLHGKPPKKKLFSGLSVQKLTTTLLNKAN